MPVEPSIRRAPVRVLRDSVARKIAAGEVIDRPASAVRELLDNALDAGATEITLYITGGGIDALSVVDNGTGMSKEDLRLCWLPHATSKIETEEDLLHVTSLGFRGEALSALAHTCRLEIRSRIEEEETGYRLIVHGGELISLEPHACRPGTVVTASDLFYALPARRKFLKRPSTETNLCRTTLLEKTLPFPDREFKLFIDGKMSLYLPPGSMEKRLSQAYPEEIDSSLLQQQAGEGPGFTFRILSASPARYRKDRKHLQLFVNNRKIWEFSLIQAVEYAFASYLPGGTYPYCYLFLTID
ncbi:MAG: DNA mismatch repair endonuclease MutL, partial [Spirochaetales bacterium]